MHITHTHTHTHTGKPLGIIGFSLLAVRAGVCQLPSSMTKRHVAAVGLLGSIGKLIYI